jgi:hypothetical protein
LVASKDDAGSLADQLRAQLAGNATAFRLDLDEDRLVRGGSGKGEVAFMPIRRLQSTTAEELASGVTLGLVAIERAASYGSPSEGGLPGGVFALRTTVGADAQGGMSVLADASGAVMLSSPVERLFPTDIETGTEALDEPSVQVGDVTVSVGWLHVCVYWDDPPGTPGGMCHRHCYGW